MPTRMSTPRITLRRHSPTAAMIGHYAIVKALLDASANVEAKDNHGWTALSLAVMRDDTAIVKLLKAAKPTKP